MADTLTLNNAMTMNTAIVPAAERKLKNRVSFWTAVQNVFTFAYRTLIKATRNPETFMDVTIMPIMFTLVFTFLFGGSVSGSIAGYLPIIIPGILIQTFVTSCSAVGVQMREDMDKSITNRFKSMPIARIAPLAGALIADIVRFLIAGIVIFTMGAIMGYRPEAGILAVVVSILFMTLIAWCLSWLFSFVALSVRSTTAASTTGMLIMFPLCFLSNAFVPSEALPGVLKFFAEHINPVSKTVSAVRQILSSGTVGTDFWLALVSVLVLLVVFIPLTLKVYMRKG
ncbi:transport permease protein [Clostridia bacterium]|nr:transport permease protein [Clostridia bacterium]